MLGDVAPAFTSHYIVNSETLHSNLPGQRLTRCTVCRLIPNPPHEVFAQLRPRLALIAWLPATTAVAVSNVDLLGTQKKMVRADAYRIIALVSDDEPLRHGTVGEFPGDTMSSAESPVIVVESSVSASDGTCAGPLPTFTGLIDTHPEAFLTGKLLWSSLSHDSIVSKFQEV